MYAQVIRTHWVTPTLIRLTLGGGDLADFAMTEETDAYINIAVPPPDAPYGALFDPAEIRRTLPKELWPARRRYTVRTWRPEVHELDVDFVVHGDSGAGGPWAAKAQPGDYLIFGGPGSGYRPDATADWHLLVGDESALPAIAASLEVLPPGAPAVVRLVCDGPEHEIPLDSPGKVDVRWLHRTGGDGDTDLLAAAVRDLEFPAGRVHAFVHGEADEIRALHRHLIAERGVPAADLSCSPYWRRGMTDEAWRSIKGEFVSAMAADV